MADSSSVSVVTVPTRAAKPVRDALKQAALLGLPPLGFPPATPRT